MSKKDKSARNSKIKRIVGAVGMPECAVSSELFIQLYSNKAVSIEGNCSVLNYSDEKIAINTAGNILKVCGSDLNIEQFGNGCLEITGCIVSVSFC